MSIEQTLRRNMRITDQRILEALAFGIEDATNYQRQLNDIDNHGTTFKEFREVTERLHNALAKVARATAGTNSNIRNAEHYLERIPRSYHGLLDTIDREFYFSMEYNPSLSRFERALSELRALGEPERQRHAEQLRAIVSEVIKDTRSPGRGGARQQARRCIMGIQCLMRHFGDTLPEHPITAKRESLFYRYVTAWMEAAGYSTNEKPTPERHIQNALADRNNWVKLSL